MGFVHNCWKKCTYCRYIITVEPVLLLYISALTMYNPLLQQYMYDEVGKYFNFTAADSHDICSKTGQRNSSQQNVSYMYGGEALLSTDSEIYEIEDKVQTETSHWILYFNMASKYVFKFLRFFFCDCWCKRYTMSKFDSRIFND